MPLTSITINMDSELIEDSIRYGTSFTPTNNIMVKKMVTFTAQTPFNPATAETPLAGIYGTPTHIVFQFINELTQIDFTINSLLMNYNLADPNTGV